jgi:hypothetical protein
MNWISVKDLKPDDGIDVLVWVEVDDGDWCDVGKYSSAMDKAGINNGWDTNYDLSKYRKITHWMPLPESPNKVE